MEEKGYMDVQRKIQEEELQEPEGQKKRSLLRELFGLVEIFLVAFLLAQVMTHFVLINAEVPSESMENIIEPGDRLFGFRLAYALEEPDRFDIVIFRYPVDESQNFIKRVIGLPGEKVEIREGKIYIDDASVPLDEPYLPEMWTDDNDGYVFQVPDDSYLMLGDNRNISLDARFWANQALEDGVAKNEQEAQQYTYVQKEQILGRAILKYFPHFQSLLDD